VFHLLVVSSLDRPILELLDLLQLAYPLHYLVLGSRFDLLVATTLLYLLQVFLSILNFLDD